MTERAGLEVDTLTMRVLMRLQRRGGRKLIVGPEGAAMPAPKPRRNETLIKALVRARRWRRRIESGQAPVRRSSVPAATLASRWRRPPGAREQAPVGSSNSRSNLSRTVTDDDAGVAGEQRVHGADDASCGCFVDGGGRLVQYQDQRVLRERGRSRCAGAGRRKAHGRPCRHR